MISWVRPRAKAGMRILPPRALATVVAPVAVLFAVCVGLSWLLAHFFMRDEDLGVDQSEGSRDA